MAKYRKRPVVIEAMQYLREENINRIQDFIGNGREFFITRMTMNITLKHLKVI